MTGADIEYRRGIALLANEDPHARQVLESAAKRAPLDPSLYLPLARAYRQRGLDERAAAMYEKFLAHAPSSPEAEAARHELAALNDDIGMPFEPSLASSSPSWSPAWSVPPLVGFLALFGWAVVRRRPRRTSLATLASEHPELQPAIAFLVGCLRHEFFKHRILAVGDAIRSVATGNLADTERRFLLMRLFGGEPLAVAWAGHVGAFMRVLGPRFDLVRLDPDFGDASRDIFTIATSEAALSRGDAEAAGRVLVAQQRLAAFDTTLGRLAIRLQHTIVDSGLLAELSADVKRELGTLSVELIITPPTTAIAVESYRFDLALVIRNVLRNAVVAAAKGPKPARVAFDIDVAIEPTGDEVVRLRVRDTNPEAVPSPAELTEARGLALIRAALQRCDGSLSVEPAGDGFAKGVVIRLFCALHSATEAA
ncbi:MAG TPA: hypothetical protein VHV78_12825 [Gemmatimonadaceae bacterium]|nr:hypothetical protein [Gemmatimonadaceae bacterium]